MDKSKRIASAGIVLLVLLCLFAGCYLGFSPKAGAGEKQIQIEVVNAEGETSEYGIVTEEEYLKGAMDELAASDPHFEYEGSDGDYGMMVEAINGERAVYEKDNCYWALYVGNKYADYGVSEQPVNDGETYTWKCEKADDAKFAK